MQDTDNKLIHIGRAIEMDDELFCRQLERLERAGTEESPDIRGLVAQMVPTYKRPEKV